MGATLVRDHLFTLWLRRGLAACGPRTHIAYPLHLMGAADRMRIGADVVIGPDTAIWMGGDAELEIGDGTRVSSRLQISAAERITIGRSVLIAWNVSILDSEHRTSDPRRPIGDQGLDRIAPVEISEGAWLGANSVVLGGVRVGRNAVVAANAVVRCDVPDHATAVGVPARIIPARRTLPRRPPRVSLRSSGLSRRPISPWCSTRQWPPSSPAPASPSRGSWSAQPF
jgi:acetyltransferase-like isoleucine patch superfamily enzyme